MEPLSVVITTFNNGRTLEYCLESVKWADEIVLVDSYSTDDTVAIAQRFGCRVMQQRFLGYSRQKQLALDQAQHRFALLLDADEALTPELQQEIRDLMARGPDADGYELPRLEQLFWRMSHPGVRLRGFLRLFDRNKGAMSTMPIHAAPKVRGTVKRLNASFYHFGVIGIDPKIVKINKYSTGLVADKLAKGRQANPLMMVVYPPFYFIRQYVFGRQFLNGWVGFMISAIDAFYVFLKYGKLYEHQQFQRHGSALLPSGAPEVVRDVADHEPPEAARNDSTQQSGA